MQRLLISLLGPLGLAVASLQMGCGDDSGTTEEATAVVVSVRSDLGSGLQSVELAVLAPGESLEDLDEDRRRAVPASEEDLPLTMVVTQGELDRVLIVVSGLDDSDAVLAQVRTTVTFSEGKTLGLPVFLASACLGRLCASDGSQTCYAFPSEADAVDAGACGEVPDLDEGDLEAITDAGDEHAWSSPEHTCDDSALDDGECNVITQCGCGGGETCRFDGASGAGRCGETGAGQANEFCDRHEDCGPGLSCTYGLCLSYCVGDQACGDGICFSVLDETGQETGSNNVCFDGCGEDGSACTGDTRCVSFTNASVCLAPLDPCPFYGDGECDEPSGNGLCAEGTDAADCCAPPQGLEGPCDLTSQCGCASEQACTVVPESTADGMTTTTACTPEGTGAAGEGCAADGDCRAGLACVGTICKPYCEQDADCMGPDGGEGICAQVLLDGEPLTGVKTCIVQCDFDGGGGCPTGSVCADFPIDECHVPRDPCPDFFVDNGTCDEDIPGGTRICAAGLDAADCANVCAVSTPPGGVCDLVSQCGCGPGLSCTITASDLTPACRMVAGSVGLNGFCEVIEDCAAGHACVAGLCKRYCAVDAECPGQVAGQCAGITDTEGNPVPGVQTCNVTCDPSTPLVGCPIGTICASDVSGRCIRPFQQCPYTDDGECDEPEGTRFCVEGSDPADCGGS